MRFNTLLLIAGLLALVFGIGFLFVPVAMLAEYGVRTDAAGLLMTRYFATALIQLGLVFCLVRNVSEPASQRAIALAGFLGSLVGLALAVRAVTTGMVNSLGWSSVAIYGLLALAYASYAFKAKASLT
jgi:xanthosine utilization system XapX-like protein